MPATTDPWLAYCFDLNVAELGLWIDGEIEAERHRKNGNPQRKLRELLQDKQRKAGQRKAMSADAWITLAGDQASVKVFE